MYWHTSLEIKWISYINLFYNIASRTFSASLVSVGKNILYFATIKDTNRDSAH